LFIITSRKEESNGTKGYPTILGQHPLHVGEENKEGFGLPPVLFKNESSFVLMRDCILLTN